VAIAQISAPEKIPFLQYVALQTIEARMFAGIDHATEVCVKTCFLIFVALVITSLSPSCSSHESAAAHAESRHVSSPGVVALR
jgi:hypothetical protein